MSELSDYLPIQEAARLYQMSDDTLYRALKQGKLRRYKRPDDKRTWLARAELEERYGRPRPRGE